MLDSAKVYSEEDLKEIAKSEGKEQLALALHSCVRNLVGRYLCQWPQTKRFEDEMVSEGFLAISEVLSKFSLDSLIEYGILKLVSRYIREKVQVYLNNNRGLTAPSYTQQKNIKRGGGEPIYVESTNNTTYSEPFEQGDVWKRDFLDTIKQLEVKDQLDAILLDESSWGKSHKELAKELGVSSCTIYRRRQRLYKRWVND